MKEKELYHTGIGAKKNKRLVVKELEIHQRSGSKVDDAGFNGLIIADAVCNRHIDPENMHLVWILLRCQCREDGPRPLIGAAHLHVHLGNGIPNRHLHRVAEANAAPLGFGDAAKDFVGPRRGISYEEVDMWEGFHAGLAGFVLLQLLVQDVEELWTILDKVVIRVVVFLGELIEENVERAVC